MRNETDGMGNQTNQTLKNNRKGCAYVYVLFAVVLTGFIALNYVLIDRWFSIPPTIDSQFDRLMGVLTFFFTVFGIAVPVGAYLLQRQSLKEKRERMLADVENKIADMQKDTKSELAFQMGVPLFHLADLCKRKLESNILQKFNANSTSPNTSYNLLVEDAISSCSLLDYCYLAIKTFDDCVKLDRSEKGKAEQHIRTCLNLFAYVNKDALVDIYEHMLKPLNERVTELLAIPLCAPDPNLKIIQEALQKALASEVISTTE